MPLYIQQPLPFDPPQRGTMLVIDAPPVEVGRVVTSGYVQVTPIEQFEGAPDFAEMDESLACGVENPEICEACQ